MLWIEQAETLLEKARHDAVIVAKGENDADIADDVLGFHVQQTAEKCMKAVLSAHGVTFRRTHDLQELHDALEAAGIAMPAEVDELVAWSPYAVMFRYGDFPNVPPVDRQRAAVLVAAAITWCEADVNRMAATASP